MAGLVPASTPFSEAITASTKGVDPRDKREGDDLWNRSDAGARTNLNRHARACPGIHAFL